MDKKILWNAIIAYAQTEQGKWLNDFAFKSVKLKELSFQKEGIVTAFYSVASNTIWLADDESFSVLFAIFVHEMRHAWQHHTMGIAKYLLKKAFSRNSIEDDAADEEQNAIDWVSCQPIFDSC